jgi:hypothetical protein
MSLASLAFAGTPKPPPIHISGTYHFEGGLNSEGKMVRDVIHPFDIYIDGDKWAISTIDHNQNLPTWAVSNRDETYSLTSLRVISGEPQDKGYVNNGPFPRFADMPVQIVWLAFASQDLVAPKPAANLLAAVNFDSLQTNGQSVDPKRSTYQVAPDSNGLPTAATIWCNPYFTENGETRHYLPPYNNGYRCGTYTVSEWYRENGIVVPKKMIFTTLFTKNDGLDASDTQFLSRYTLTVTKVETLFDQANLALVSKTGSTTMYDYRFVDSVPLVYVVRNSQWLPRASIHWVPAMRAGMIEYLRQITHTTAYPGLPPPNPLGRILLFAAMFIFTTLFPIGFWWTHRKGSKVRS